MLKNLTLGISPCPNDTFMFNKLINTENNLSFKLNTFLKDVEELNQLALKRKTDITKLSFSAFFKVVKDYIILNSGSALGRGCGPLIISKKKLEKKDLNGLKIAVPGINTTAFLLFSLFCEGNNQIVPMLFSEIENAILNNEVDAGLIIHESRFTYILRGLNKVVDLGDWWEKETGYPIPLGCIAIKRELINEGLEFDKALRNSIDFAFKNRENCYPFIKKHAQELDDKVIDSHINLYVNDFSLNLGNEGKSAIEFLYKQAIITNFIEKTDRPLFID